MKFTLLVSLLFLAGCAASNYTVNDKMSSEEGIAAFTFDCAGVQNIDIYPSGTVYEDDILNPSTFKSSAKVPCARETEVKLVKLKEGNYFFGSVLAFAVAGNQIKGKRHYVPETQAYKFSVKPNAINYIGNVMARITNSRYASRSTTLVYSLNIDDYYEGFEDRCSAENKAVIEKYDLVKLVAQRPQRKYKKKPDWPAARPLTAKEVDMLKNAAKRIECEQGGKCSESKPEEIDNLKQIFKKIDCEKEGKCSEKYPNVKNIKN